jgi:hypothetical protein
VHKRYTPGLSIYPTRLDLTLHANRPQDSLKSILIYSGPFGWQDATGGGAGAGEAASDASTEQFNDYVNSLLSAPTPVTAVASDPAPSTVGH